MGALFRWSTAPFRLPVRAFLRLLPPAVSSAISFELGSWVGRRLARRLQVDPARRNYLNLGGADEQVEGFVSVDFFSGGPGYGADLRYPLLIDGAVFDGIFSEHTLEHLSYPE